ncbi:MAG: hypothetical protein K1X35_01780 [Caulobacteraceae bacterium]|nr:hypothetical protein [Caulobacteraceae bacterium]
MSKRPGLWRWLAAPLLVLSLSVGAVGAQAPYSPNLRMRQVFHDGERRTYGLYVPQHYDPARPATVIVALHGRYSSAKAFHAFSRLADLAERRGAILVYPEPLGVSWGDSGPASSGQALDADNVGFIGAALAHVDKSWDLDLARVFLIGYDTGGVLALRASCLGPTRFAGVAVISALMRDLTRAACPASAHAAPTLLIHGARDENYPVRGDAAQGGAGGHRLSLADTLSTLRSLNGCSPSRATSRSIEPCPRGMLAFLPVPGGATEWYRDGPHYRFGRHGFDATEVLERFFFEPGDFSLPQVREDGASHRSWITYAPSSYDPSRPTPLVVLLHGRPSNATAMGYITRMHEVADRHGFILVYPEGLNNEWNAFYDLTRQHAVAPQDDVAFLKGLTQDLGQDFNIDRTRMYLGGFSNGGFMTIRMACSAGDVFAGFAVVAAELYTVLKDKCRGGAPTPILLMHGTADPSVPYNGVVIRSGADDQETRVSLGARDTLAWFVERNHCSQAGSMTTFPIKGNSVGTQAQRFMPHDCAVPVSFYLITGGGHTWPGTVPLEGLGEVNMDINAGEEIWQFFEPLRLRPTAER